MTEMTENEYISNYLNSTLEHLRIKLNVEGGIIMLIGGEVENKNGFDRELYVMSNIEYETAKQLLEVTIRGINDQTKPRQ